MTIERWSVVDEYIAAHLVPSDSALDNALTTTQAAEIPSINVAPNQGKLLHLLARMMGAARILEIGTLGGYSTIWLARALPSGGSLVTLEFSPKHAETALVNMREAGLDSAVTIRLGAALDTLPVLFDEGAGPFDFIFIDADKVNNAKYLDWALKLSRVGTVIVCDNVVRDGRGCRSRCRFTRCRRHARIF